MSRSEGRDTGQVSSERLIECCPQVRGHIGGNIDSFAGRAVAALPGVRPNRQSNYSKGLCRFDGLAKGMTC